MSEEENMVTEVSVDELEQARATGATIIDVRESEEYAAGHVPGAQLIPLGVVPVRVNELPTRQPVYVICGSGGRSYQAAEYLTGAGIDARSVAGGTSAWERGGRPLESGAPRQ
jgi:rhodanese-related sulfurtransferase